MSQPRRQRPPALKATFAGTGETVEVGMLRLKALPKDTQPAKMRELEFYLVGRCTEMYSVIAGIQRMLPIDGPWMNAGCQLYDAQTTHRGVNWVPFVFFIGKPKRPCQGEALRMCRKQVCTCIVDLGVARLFPNARANHQLHMHRASPKQGLFGLPSYT